MILFDEREKIKNILSNDYVVKKINLADLKLIAQYFDSNGEDVKKSIEKYIKEHCLGGYDEVRYEFYIDECVKYCKKYKLKENQSIPLTKREFELLLTLNKKEELRIMFVMLMYSKHFHVNVLNKSLNDVLYFNGKLNELFKVAKVTYTKKRSREVIKSLQDHGMIDWGFGDYAKILMFDKDDLDILEKFIPSENIVNYIIGFEKGHKSMKCDVCSEWFYALKGSKTRKCDKCSEKIKREQSKNRKRLFDSK